MRKKVLSLCIILLFIMAIPMFTACNETVSYDFNDNNFGYTINTDGENTVTLSVLINKELVNAIIPATIDNIGKTYTVTQLGEAVFAPIPDGVTLNEAFHYDTNQDEANEFLTTLTFANGSQVSTINGRVFEKCKNLTSVTLPNSLTTIKGFAFYKCTSLAEITIPSSVTSIGDYAFESCLGLETVNLLANDKDNLPNIGVNAFKWYDKSKVEFMGNQETYLMIEGLTIKVINQDMLDAFKATEFSNILSLRNWNDYKDIMSVEEV